MCMINIWIMAVFILPVWSRKQKKKPAWHDMRMSVSEDAIWSGRVVGELLLDTVINAKSLWRQNCRMSCLNGMAIITFILQIIMWKKSVVMASPWCMPWNRWWSTIPVTAVRWRWMIAIILNRRIGQEKWRRESGHGSAKMRYLLIMKCVICGWIRIVWHGMQTPGMAHYISIITAI